MARIIASGRGSAHEVPPVVDSGRDGLLDIKVLSEGNTVVNHKELTLRAFTEKKIELRDHMFLDEGGNKIKLKAGAVEDVKMLPCTRTLVNMCRGTFCFRGCIARERSTPLTELHLMQPVLGIFLVYALALSAVVVLQLVGIIWMPAWLLQALAFYPQAVVSAMLLYVGWIAKTVPSHEHLNNILNDELHTLETNIEAQRTGAGEIEKMQEITLQWLDERGKERNEVSKVAKALREIQEEFWRFQLKSQLLKYLADGEDKITRRKQDALLRDRSKWADSPDTLKDMMDALLPDGKLDTDELKQVCTTVKTIVKGGLFEFLGEVLEDVMDTELPAEQPCIQAGESDTGLSKWTYGRIVDLVYERVKTGKYKDAFHRVFREDVSNTKTY